MGALKFSSARSGWLRDGHARAQERASRPTAQADCTKTTAKIGTESDAEINAEAARFGQRLWRWRLENLA